MYAQKGNALFLILIAVALFAALSYAITTSSRGGSNSNRENILISAAEITQYAGALQSAITRMRLVNGCADTTISFWTDTNGDGAATAADTYYNPTAPTDFSCHVFHPVGGGVAPQSAPALARLSDDFSYNGGHPVIDVPTPTPPNTAELLLALRDINRDVCLEINKAVGVPLSAGDAPQEPDPDFFTQKFIGVYVTGNHITSANMRGRREGCFKNPSGMYFYFAVLIERA
ncbi:type II secretory pathway pseudopilin PulG [Porphyrobacter sp. MBR-155]|jgi:type II secretory pathway pseudopilin PulG|uniref:hypothetical protein n=1 Tax=Porphyrobacter sp. MBR-155 TaxID=3156464 RepID=UPI0033966970